MFILARLLVYIAFVVQAVLALQIIGPTASATRTISAQVTATWILQGHNDVSLLNGFMMVLVNDDPRAGEVPEWSTVVNPNGKSTGIVKLIPTATGTHHIEALSLQTGSGSPGSSNSFDVDSDSDSDSGSDPKKSSSTTTQPSTSRSSSSSSQTSSTSSSSSSSPLLSITQYESSAISTSTSSFIGALVTGSSSFTISATIKASYTSPIPSPTRSSQPSNNVVAIALSAVFGTILFMLILLAILLLVHRRRHSKISSHLTNQAKPWYHPKRFYWNSTQRVSGASRYDNSDMFETSKTVPMSVWDAPESWDTLSLTPSDSVSRLLSLKRVRDLQQESVVDPRMRSRLATGDRIKGMISSDIAHDSDVGTAVVEETKWVHAGGAELIPQIRTA
ncbi:hypothetical protein F5880DRAFT_918665 [Lentinula raphanica]|nr:hypothetical protein F5880DRAFT_918665 [Lentinula raphanica]